MYSRLGSGNNSKPKSTDPEIMTSYLYAKHVEQHFKIKQIFEFKKHDVKIFFL